MEHFYELWQWLFLFVCNWRFSLGSKWLFSPGANTGGGLIFYVNEDGFNVYDGKGGVKECHYLEMTEFAIGKLPWGPLGYDFVLGGSNSREIGYGKSNTYKIVQLYNDYGANENNCAAKACYLYKTETTSAGDWFLPSERELDILVEYLPERLKLVDNAEYYHSSSSILTITTGVFHILHRVEKVYKKIRKDYYFYDDDYKWETYYDVNYFLVRPIRAF